MNLIRLFRVNRFLSYAALILYIYFLNNVKLKQNGMRRGDNYFNSFDICFI